jgi:hypothetical protein
MVRPTLASNPPQPSNRSSSRRLFFLDSSRSRPALSRRFPRPPFSVPPPACRDCPRPLHRRRASSVINIGGSLLTPGVAQVSSQAIYWKTATSPQQPAATPLRHVAKATGVPYLAPGLPRILRSQGDPRPHRDRDAPRRHKQAQALWPLRTPRHSCGAPEKPPNPRRAPAPATVSVTPVNSSLVVALRDAYCESNG